ncbi:MAG TPA: HAMP domain-containing sensor histidine kinase [Gaiellaceae bacterium]|nr:HAMP domain-containing sensor histidine kinase [Gaiellaceae bacterium]
MNLFGSVGGKLALALLAVVAGVLAIVYVIVVPLYSSSLRNAELSTLAGQLRSGMAYLHDPSSPAVDDWAAAMHEQYDVRALVFTYTPFTDTVSPFADSNLTTDDTNLINDPVALRAIHEGALVRGVTRHGARTFAEAAFPIQSQSEVAMFAAPLDEQLETIGVVRRRVLLAGAAAMLFAALLGYLGARLFTRRIRRLESAADRIAAGDFGEAVVDTGSDELGQLARTFERMRLRLSTLDRARGEFIANASHELRTPLFSLGGYLELLEDPDLDEPTRRDFLAQMVEQVNRLTRLATDLLDLSRIDAGRLGVSREPIDLAEIAGELAQEFRPRAAASGHPLELAAPEAAPALGDAERALQIGRVLLENALVHTPAGTTVRLEAATDGGRAVLTVADDGPGIPAEAQEQVFHRFYRLEGTRASGSGLGLAIARELADVLGGRLELDASGAWTRFSLVLAADREGEPDRLHVKTLDPAH